MAVALVETFGHYFEQIVLCGDPMFLKRLTDYARDRGVDWSRYRVNVIIGEEIFGERFREYLAASLGLHPDRPISKPKRSHVAEPASAGPSWPHPDL